MPNRKIPPDAPSSNSQSKVVTESASRFHFNIQESVSASSLAY